MNLYSNKLRQQNEKLLREFCAKQDYKSMLPILESFISHDMGKVQLWKYRDYYRSLPKEYVENSPAICSALCLLAILSADFEQSDFYIRELRRMQTKHRSKSPEYHEIENFLLCMEVICPQRNDLTIYQTLRSLVHLVLKQGQRKVMLSITANKPSIINGGRDFTAYSHFIPKVKTILRYFAKVLYDKKSAGMFDTALAEIYYQENKLYEALVLSVSAISIIEREGDVNILFAAMYVQFWTLLINGQIENTHPMIESMREKILADEADYLIENLNALAVWGAMYDSDHKRIDQWMENEAPNEFGEICTLERFQYSVKLRVYILYGKHFSAISLAERLRPVLTGLKRRMELCELDLLLAISHYDAGEKDLAFSYLESCLATAEKYSFLRLIANEGERAYLLLQAYAGEHVPHSFLKRVIELSYAMALQFPNYLKKRQQAIEALTEQEEAVLRLMAAGRNNTEIASFLGVSVNTVKYHCKNLFQKLGVNRRQEAVLVAIDNKLINKKNYS